MQLEQVPIAQLDTIFERFRLVDPAAESRIRESVSRHGQLTPLLVGRIDERLVLVDGFKRLRAMRSEGLQLVQVNTVEHSVQALKAMVLCVNQQDSVCRDIEEALVVYSLHREDGLQQQEIATLCGRHKSWVCRRIGLMERLSEEVVEQVRLGLVPISIAWELVRLQRCNQPSALQTIRTHELSCRQTHRLVEELLRRPMWQQQQLLRDPGPVVGASVHPRLDCGAFSGTLRLLLCQLSALEKDVRHRGLGSLTPEQCLVLRRELKGICARGAVLLNTVAAGMGEAS